MLGKAGMQKLLKPHNKPLCSLAPRTKVLCHGKVYLHHPIQYDNEGRRIITMKRGKF